MSRKNTPDLRLPAKAALIVIPGLTIALVLTLIGILGVLGTRAQTQPELVSVSPDTVLVGSQDVFTITGSAFEKTPTITLDSYPLVDVGFVSTATLTATVPVSLPAGVYTVTLTNPGGLGDSLPDSLTVQNPAPRLLGLRPDRVIYGQASDLTITGTHFVATPTVRLNETSCSAVQFVSSTTLTATMPGDLPPGEYDVTVVNPGPYDPQETVQNALTVYSPSPTVRKLAPQEVPNNLDTALEITGTNFVPTPTVSLGRIALQGISWVSATRLTAVVPWGLDPGAYNMTVTNPGPSAASVMIADAFTATQAIGVWTTGGPYGGTVDDLAVSPVTSETAFAAVRGAGLFRTKDGGGRWDLLIEDAQPEVVTYGPTDDVLYCGGGGLWRSKNEGDDWDVLVDEGMHTCVPHPEDERRIWMAGGQGVWLLTTLPGGDVERELRADGLPSDSDTGIGVLAADPVSTSVVYAGLWDGRVFRTKNSGATWEDVSDGLGPPHGEHSAQALAIHPEDPEVLLYSRWLSQVSVFRSDDRGDSWTGIEGEPDATAKVTDLAFSPQVSGTVYASLMGESLMAVSEDAGRTWSPLGERVGDWMLSLALDPISGRPVYLGGGSGGTYRSDDGGETWALKTEGIGGLPVLDIAASPARPENVWVAADITAFESEDAGRSWRAWRGGARDRAAFSVARDPVNPEGVYVGSGRGVFRTGDGETWEYASLPVTYHNHVDALAVSPVSPSVVYAGGHDSDAFEIDRSLGMVCRSDDGGRSWVEVASGEAISMVSDIAIAPVMTETVYVATRKIPAFGVVDPGLGVFRTEDGGATWKPVVEGMGHTSVTALAIHPSDPETIYAGGMITDTGEWAVFKSEDGGDSWARTAMQLAWGRHNDLAIDPLEPDTVYAGTGMGLFRTTDGGASWNRAAGEFGSLSIKGLAIAASDERTILYLGTVGGFSSGASAQLISSMELKQETYVRGGVYQQTIDHRSPVGVIYLPCVLRNG